MTSVFLHEAPQTFCWRPPSSSIVRHALTPLLQAMSSSSCRAITLCQWLPCSLFLRVAFATYSCDLSLAIMWATLWAIWFCNVTLSIQVTYCHKTSGEQFIDVLNLSRSHSVCGNYVTAQQLWRAIEFHGAVQVWSLTTRELQHSCSWNNIWEDAEPKTIERMQSPKPSLWRFTTSCGAVSCRCIQWQQWSLLAKASTMSMCFQPGWEGDPQWLHCLPRN